ncbi:sugar phosphate isomerase/epimerase family protein [Cupriavidus necator]|uniref:sugar phosphate isomerase/epimerase family protein n=1 Tax=Cupriavidus necator TaxID=106590 RepID=UPI001E45D16C|nr:sugar phosphate isomerase/epimerase [Cupriavidus necator]
MKPTFRRVMRISISNIAWEVADDAHVVALLQKHGVDAIDIAPGKYFPHPTAATTDEIAIVRRWWESRGIGIVGMQALLFGTTGLNVFGSTESRAGMMNHLISVCRIAAELGATRLVFGSPKNRDRSGLSDAMAHEIAVAFFYRLGQIASTYGVTVCLEPNPPRYGANFMTNSDETASVVAAVGHPAIRMQFDTGAVAINGEDAQEVVETHSQLIGHVHASEPDLVTLGDGHSDHASAAAALRSVMPNQIVAVEMVISKREPALLAVDRALDFAVAQYREIRGNPA